jgi:hypothetical protein
LDSFRPEVEALEARLTPTLSFAARQTVATNTIGTFGMAIADVNGDGKPDFAVVNDMDATVSVLRNTSAPTGNPPWATYSRILPGMACGNSTRSTAGST